MIDNLTIEEIKWLLNDYNRIREYGKVNSWIDYHIKALRLLKGKWGKPSCSCEYVAHSKIANSTYKQYEQELKNKLLSYENANQQTSPTTTRGRKKKIEE